MFLWSRAELQCFKIGDTADFQESLLKMICGFLIISLISNSMISEGFFFILAALVMGLFLLQVSEYRIERLPIYLTIILVLVATFLRFGQDTIAYTSFYYTFPRGLNLSQFWQVMLCTNYEYGFMFINLVLRKLDISHHFLFLTTSTIAVTSNIFVFKKTKDLFLSSVMIYISTYYLWNEHVQIRQGMSSALFLISIYFLSFGTSKKFLLGQVGAALMHRVGYMSPVLLLLKYIRARIFYVALLFITLAFAVFADLKQVLEFIENLNLLHWKIADYLNSPIFSNGLSLTSIRVLKSIVISTLLFALWEKVKKDPFIFLLARTYLFGVFLQFIFSDLYVLSIRTSQHFMISELILIPFLARYFFQKKFTYFCFFFALASLGKHFYLAL